MNKYVYFTVKSDAEDLLLFLRKNTLYKGVLSHGALFIISFEAHDIVSVAPEYVKIIPNTKLLNLLYE